MMANAFFRKKEERESCLRIFKKEDELQEPKMSGFREREKGIPESQLLCLRLKETSERKDENALG